MAKSLCALLLMVALFLAAAQDAQQQPPQKVSAADLKEAKICSEGRACKFSALMSMQSKDDAATARGNSRKEEENLHVVIKFSVESHCGTSAIAFFKLTVTEYHRQNDPNSGQIEADVLKNNPCYFKQDRSDGTITEVIFGKEDQRFSQNIKQGLIHTMAKKIHPEAIKKAADNPGGAPVTYFFQDEDYGGKFSAKHEVRSVGKNIVLLEMKDYDDTLDETTSKTKGVEADGQKMDVNRSSLSTTAVAPDGHVEDVKENSKVNIGTDDQPADPPVYPTPSTGKTNFGNQFDINKISDVAFVGHCTPSDQAEQIETDIDTSLHGSIKRPLRKPLTMEQMQADPFTEAHTPPATLTARAKSLLQQGQFSITSMMVNLCPENIPELTKYARDLYSKQYLSLRAMKTFLGALASVRTDDSYKELLGVLYAHGADENLRQQALLSLLHIPGEPAPPAYVVDIVEDLANKRSDSMSSGATMLLGALLEKHSASLYGATKIASLSHKLNALNPNNEATSFDAMVLIGSLRNSASRSYKCISAIKRFTHSEIHRVRTAALDALHALRKKTTANNEATSDVQEDPNNVDDVSKDDKTRTEGGRLAEVKIPLTGNPNFGVSAVLYSGAEWDSNVAIAMGNAEVEVKVLFFKMKVMNIGARYSLKKGVEIGGPGDPKQIEGGNLSFMMTVIGKVVLQKDEEATPEDIVMGGKCPDTLQEAPQAKRHAPQEWYLPLFMFQQLFPLGPFPVTLTVTVGGRMGFELYGGVNADCSYGAKQHQVEIVGGFGPYVAVDVIMDAALNMGVAKAGIEGTLLIIKATLPLYGVANTQIACGHIDIELEALSGKIIGYVEVLKKKVVTIPILKWTGPQKTIHLMNQCKNVELDSFPELKDVRKASDDDKEKKVAEQRQEEENAKREELEKAAEKESEQEDERYESRQHGPVGDEVLNKMRRQYEKELGEKVDPAFGTTEQGWPWNDMTKQEKEIYGWTNPKKKSPQNATNEVNNKDGAQNNESNENGNENGNEKNGANNQNNNGEDDERDKDGTNYEAALVHKAAEAAMYEKFKQAVEVPPDNDPAFHFDGEPFETEEMTANLVDRFARKVARDVLRKRKIEKKGPKFDPKKLRTIDQFTPKELTGEEIMQREEDFRKKREERNALRKARAEDKEEVTESVPLGNDRNTTMSNEVPIPFRITPDEDYSPLK